MHIQHSLTAIGQLDEDAIVPLAQRKVAHRSVDRLFLAIDPKPCRIISQSDMQTDAPRTGRMDAGEEQLAAGGKVDEVLVNSSVRMLNSYHEDLVREVGCDPLGIRH